MLVCDIRESITIAKYCIKNRVETIINCASLSSVAESWQNPDEYMEVNGYAVDRLLMNLRTHDYQGLFYQLGSTDMYGQTHITNIDNDMKPWSPYRISKVFAFESVKKAEKLGISQLNKIQSFKEFRGFLFQKYREFLSQYEFITLPTVRSYVEPMWHLFPIRVPKEIRKDIYLALHGEGIKVQVNYIPSYWLSAFDPKIHPKGLCPIAEDFYSWEISMPMYVEEFLLSDEYFDRLDSVFYKYA
jgi:hypothetical protein